jgi:DNA mismatch repair protein MutL
MNKIKKLSEKLINQIAAGEVVERPASVVKELVENALDAGSQWVEVEIKGGGLQLIKVSDDGEGMGKEDARLAVEKHATSKIETIQDLSDIHSFGFRGEALSSIASVSHFEMNTRKKNDASGTQVKVQGGGDPKITESARPQGTTLTISNLFYNTPARLKFMKKQSTEEKHILLVMETYALAYPGVGFKLHIDGKEALNAAPGPIKSRLFQVFGKESASQLAPLDYADQRLKITGVVSVPTVSRPTRENMLFFVNRRWVMNPSLGHAVMTGFHTLLPTRRFPLCVVFIDIPTDQVDVNVHPTKREVKFSKDRDIYDAIVRAVRKAVLNDPSTAIIHPGGEHLSALALTSASFTPEKAPLLDIGSSHSLLQENVLPYDFARVLGRNPDNPIETQTGSVTDNLHARRIDPQVSLCNFTQLFNTFILFQTDDELFIADQHTVHERLNYEKLMKGLKEKKFEIQPLLIPITLELNPKEALWLRDHTDLLMEMGLEVAPFGGNTFVIRSVLADLAGKNLSALLREMIEDLSKKESDGTGGSHRIDQIRERALTFFSCRSAVMAGDRLNEEQMRALIERMRKENLPFTCPHGRPTLLSIPITELYKKFDRH